MLGTPKKKAPTKKYIFEILSCLTCSLFQIVAKNQKKAKKKFFENLEKCLLNFQISDNKNKFPGTIIC